MLRTSAPKIPESAPPEAASVLALANGPEGLWHVVAKPSVVSRDSWCNACSCLISACWLTLLVEPSWRPAEPRGRQRPERLRPCLKNGQRPQPRRSLAEDLALELRRPRTVGGTSRKRNTPPRTH